MRVLRNRKGQIKATSVLRAALEAAAVLVPGGCRGAEQNSLQKNGLFARKLNLLETVSTAQIWNAKFFLEMS